MKGGKCGEDCGVEKAGMRWWKKAEWKRSEGGVVEAVNVEGERVEGWRRPRREKGMEVGVLSGCRVRMVEGWRKAPIVEECRKTRREGM